MQGSEILGEEEATEEVVDKGQIKENERSKNKADEYQSLVEDFSSIAIRGQDGYQEDREGRNIEYVSIHMGGRYGVVIQTDERGLPSIQVSRTDIDNRGNPKSQRFFTGLRVEASTRAQSIQTLDLMGRLDTTVQEFEVASKAFDLTKKAISQAQQQGEERQKKLDEEEKEYFPPIVVGGEVASTFAAAEEDLDLNRVTDLVVLTRQTIKKKLGATLDKVDTVFYYVCDTVEYADTQGFKIDSVVPRVGLSVEVRTKKGSRAFGSIRGSFGGVQVLKRFADNSDEKSYEGIVTELAEEVAKEAIDLDKAQSSTMLGTSCPVILSAAAAGVLAHEAFGHVSESDVILENKESKRADVNLKSRIGGQVSENQKVTIIDSGNHVLSYGEHKIRHAFGAIARDDHGSKPRDTILVKNGVQEGVMLSRYDVNEIVAGLKKEVADSIIGNGLTGNVRSEDYSNKPLVRMTNTYMMPNDVDGAKTIEEMAAKVPKNKKGVYVATVSGGWVQPDTGDFQIIGNLGYLIENGQVVWTKPIKGVKVNGNITKLQIKSIGSSSTSLKSFCGFCGKNSQRAPTEGRGPALYIEDANISTSSTPYFADFREEYKDFIKQLREVEAGERIKESVYIHSVAEHEREKSQNDEKSSGHYNVCMITSSLGSEEEVDYWLGTKKAGSRVED